jgi:hypothetical protein
MRNSDLPVATSSCSRSSAGARCASRRHSFNVSVATAYRWLRRWRDAAPAERSSLTCLFDRSEPTSTQSASPRARARAGDLRVPEEDRLGPRLVAGATGFCHSTMWKVLRRAELSRPPRALREPARRYEWPCRGTSCTWTRASTPASSGRATPTTRCSEVTLLLAPVKLESSMRGSCEVETPSQARVRPGTSGVASDHASRQGANRKPC